VTKDCAPADCKHSLTAPNSLLNKILICYGCSQIFGLFHPFKSSPYTHSIYLRSILILSSHIILCPPSVHFFQVFPPKCHVCSSPSPAPATCPTHLILLRLLICQTILCAAQIVQLPLLPPLIPKCLCSRVVSQ